MDELHQIVQRMIDAGESEEAIASVIQEYDKQTPSPTPVTPGVLAGVGAAAATPAVVSGINAAANLERAMPYKRSAPLIAGAFAVKDLAEGRYKAAAAEGAMAAAPAVARAVAMKTGAISPLARGAGWLSKFAGEAAGPVTIASLLYDTYQDFKAHPEKYYNAPQNVRAGRPFE